MKALGLIKPSVMLDALRLCYETMLLEARVWHKGVAVKNGVFDNLQRLNKEYRSYKTRSVPISLINIPMSDEQGGQESKQRPVSGEALSIGREVLSAGTEAGAMQ